MKKLLIWLALGAGVASITSCNSEPAISSPLPDRSNFPMLETPQNHSNVIDEAVISALKQQREVPVIIELHPILSVAPETLSDEARAKQVKMVQDLVLNTLAQDEFRLKYRSEIMFMMAGWITMQGAVKLRQNQYTARVSLDGVSRLQ
ncbi:MAG: hypothetical protein E6Q83_16190 [Thiothrix sp.]|nr:MAG: hypothetical protein E6Q83_16190 [Thiothrix sp.]